MRTTTMRTTGAMRRKIDLTSADFCSVNSVNDTADELGVEDEHLRTRGRT